MSLVISWEIVRPECSLYVWLASGEVVLAGDPNAAQKVLGNGKWRRSMQTTRIRPAVGLRQFAQMGQIHIRFGLEQEKLIIPSSSLGYGMKGHVVE